MPFAQDKEIFWITINVFDWRIILNRKACHAVHRSHK